MFGAVHNVIFSPIKGVTKKQKRKIEIMMTRFILHTSIY